MSLYTAQVATTGGRNGHAQSTDNLLSVDFAFPKEMGGNGNATNPEQLFAAGWSACFGQSLAFVAQQEGIKIDVNAIVVTAKVGVGQRDGGFHLEAELSVSIPGLEKSVIEGLITKAETVCAYSNAVRGNVPATFSVV